MAAIPQKIKIFNDPIYGFVTVKEELIFRLIDHPFFQRLRRIKQLGMTHLVYPGALHTRFHHAMGATHLMEQALETLKNKGVEITAEEEIAAKAAILLHDIGHGPFSHALEHSIVSGIHHEELSILFMERLNEEFNGALDKAIAIFRNTYPKKFLHQLVSSQLDVDRLDYLNRDSFYTGVSEGVISWDRIIKTLNVKDDQLVVDSKGIYSIEKFIVSRRLMYWQVYLHKTVISAENMLVNILKRAKQISDSNKLWATPAFSLFLSNKYSMDDFRKDKRLLEQFALLDDYDIFTSIKVWMDHPDPVLSQLCRKLVNRQLFKLEIQKDMPAPERLEDLKVAAVRKYQVSLDDLHYFVYTGSIRNSAYHAGEDKINILQKDGKLVDIAEASDQLNISVLANTVEKFFVSYPKDLSN